MSDIYCWCVQSKLWCTILIILVLQHYMSSCFICISIARLLRCKFMSFTQDVFIHIHTCCSSAQLFNCFQVSPHPKANLISIQVKPAPLHHVTWLWYHFIDEEQHAVETMSCKTYQINIKLYQFLHNYQIHITWMILFWYDLVTWLNM